MKVQAPDNNLGPYLTKRLKDKGQDSTDISEVTKIPIASIRNMRSGSIKSIPAIESFKIALFVGDSIDIYLKNIYPNLKLKFTDKPLSKNIKTETSETGKVIFSLEEFNLDILAHRTGIKRDRLYRLTKLSIEKIETYELALIEMATQKEPGELFNVLFKNVTLKNPSE